MNGSTMNWKTRRRVHAPAAESIRHHPIGASFDRTLLAGLLSVAALAGSPALAQQPQPTATPSTPPTLAYRSAFARYKPYADQDVSAWREANDGVGRIGGWRVYAREARQPEAAEPARTPPSTDMKPASPMSSDPQTGRPAGKP
jgi:hypothetical protein